MQVDFGVPAAHRNNAIVIRYFLKNRNEQTNICIFCLIMRNIGNYISKQKVSHAHMRLISYNFT